MPVTLDLRRQNPQNLFKDNDNNNQLPLSDQIQLLNNNINNLSRIHQNPQLSQSSQLSSLSTNSNINNTSDNNNASLNISPSQSSSTISTLLPQQLPPPPHSTTSSSPDDFNTFDIDDYFASSDNNQNIKSFLLDQLLSNTPVDTFTNKKANNNDKSNVGKNNNITGSGNNNLEISLNSPIFNISNQNLFSPSPPPPPPQTSEFSQSPKTTNTASNNNNVDLDFSDFLSSDVYSDDRNSSSAPWFLNNNKNNDGSSDTATSTESTSTNKRSFQEQQQQQLQQYVNRQEFFHQMNLRLSTLATFIKGSMKKPEDYSELWDRLYALLKQECQAIQKIIDVTEYKSLQFTKTISQFSSYDVTNDPRIIVPDHASEFKYVLNVTNDGNDGFRSISILLNVLDWEKVGSKDAYHEELRVRTVLEMVNRTDKNRKSFEKHTEEISANGGKITTTSVYPGYFQKDTIDMAVHFGFATNAPQYAAIVWQIESLNTCINGSLVGVPQLIILSNLLKAIITIIYPDIENRYFRTRITLTEYQKIQAKDLPCIFANLVDLYTDKGLKPCAVKKNQTWRYASSKAAAEKLQACHNYIPELIHISLNSFSVCEEKLYAAKKPKEVSSNR
ncbi:79_t:CDS:2 [Entrophospora sp. SA101]|nr:79_t:CDS:2 [Entrophospora sp. SA101]